MRQRFISSDSTDEKLGSHGVAESPVEEKKPLRIEKSQTPRGSAFSWLALLVVLALVSWFVHHVQFDRLPLPLDANQAGKRGFSELQALLHVKALTKLGPHPVGSDALDLALQYVLVASENIKKEAHWEVNVEVDYFHAEPGANRLVGGLFKGRTLLYSDLKHVVMRISPKYHSDAEENAILISSHIDTVFSAEGAGDCSSCVAVMLELARATSQWAHGFKQAVIFLFNTGEEEGLNGAHSFIIQLLQHPWSETVQFVVDLEAMGTGGKSAIFQSGPDPLSIESFAAVAKYPSGQIIAQDIFHSGVIKSGTDFQVYREVAGLSGLDFAYGDVGAVYHTKNDKLKLLKPGSLQHLGENMLPFILKTATMPPLPKEKAGGIKEDRGHNQMVFFDILGMYMIVYHQSLVNMLYGSVILQSLLIWTASLVMGGPSSVICLCISMLSVLMMWVLSITFSVLVAFLLPRVCSSPVPYIANPWLIVGLFGPPAIVGALLGQHLGSFFLQKFLLSTYLKIGSKKPNYVNSIKWEAQRWLFKAGFVQWLIILITGTICKVGSSYFALVWLVSPAFSYGLLEATLSPIQSPKQLRTVTLVIGLAAPIIITAGIVIRLMGTIIGTAVRVDRNPGGTPEWLASVVIATLVAAIVCLTHVYLLSYAQFPGARRSIILAAFALFGITLAFVVAELIPPFTEDVSRAVNVLHVVETTGKQGGKQNPLSYVSLSSVTPGKLKKEVASLENEGFVCGNNKTLDLVTFTVHYGCFSSVDTGEGWSKSELPIMQIKSDLQMDGRVTTISIDTKISTRWSLAINMEEVEDFSIEESSKELVPRDKKFNVDGWHIIQYSGGKNSPTKFDFTLYWLKNSTPSKARPRKKTQDSHLLLKLRTDLNRVTPKVARVLEKLPIWCSLFGKSTSPFTFSFLSSLEVDF
ncbi:hypothetical protein AMTRI_Chr07g23690 [Amborella trichopoda]